MRSPVSFQGVWEMTRGVFSSPLGMRRTSFGYWLKASQVMHHFVAFITESLLLFTLPCFCAPAAWIGARSLLFCFSDSKHRGLLSMGEPHGLVGLTSSTHCLLHSSAPHGSSSVSEHCL